jgi:hypothetical protein
LVLPAPPLRRFLRDRRADLCRDLLGERFFSVVIRLIAFITGPTLAEVQLTGLSLTAGDFFRTALDFSRDFCPAARRVLSGLAVAEDALHGA